MRPIRIAALLVTIGFLISSALAAVPQQLLGTSSVEGIVTRADTGAPIPGVKVH